MVWFCNAKGRGPTEHGWNSETGSLHLIIVLLLHLRELSHQPSRVVNLKLKNSKKKFPPVGSWQEENWFAGGGRKQVTKRSAHARPGMHMQQCSAVHSRS